MSALPVSPPHALIVEHRMAHDCQHVRATCACGWVSPNWYSGVVPVGREYWVHEMNATFCELLAESERP